MKNLKFSTYLAVALMFSACSIKDTNHYNFAKNTMYEKTQNYTKYHTHSKILPPDLDQNVNQLPEIYDEIYIDESKFLRFCLKISTHIFGLDFAIRLIPIKLPPLRLMIFRRFSSFKTLFTSEKLIA